MTWNLLLNSVVKILDLVPECDPPVERSATQGEAFHKLEALELNTSASVDAAIRQLSRANEIHFSPAEHYFLRQRLVLGLCIAQALNTPLSDQPASFVPCPPQADRESMLEWLLIDVWRSTNRHRWLAMLESGIGPTGAS